MNKEVNITRCLFEGLTSNDPATMRPCAALATHFEIRASGTLLIFYLRGCRNPKGMVLPGAEQWPAGEPARWSDGSPVTAKDFVYSWRRFIDPGTAAPFATYLYYVKNAEAISGGALSAKDLAVEAPDDFTLKIELRSPVPFFLTLTAAGALAAVPSQAVEAARQAGCSWTQPGRVVVSGAFRLHEWRPYERIVLRRNPSYYNARAVRLAEICFIPVSDGVTNVNLFKAGEGDSMSDSVLPSQFLPALEGAEELQVRPALDSFFYGLSVEKPPFDNPLLRYALNMAIDKRAVARVMGGCREPAATYVPPLWGYPRPERLLFALPGGECDVLSYDPASASFWLHPVFPMGCGPMARDCVSILATGFVP
jgi:ABC-type oligopeptide transport system substrate-binding subunit